MASNLLKKQLLKSQTRQKVQKRLSALADRVYRSETHRTSEDLIREYEDLQYLKAVAFEDALEHNSH